MFTYGLFVLEQVLHGHLSELGDLRLLRLHVLTGVGRHVRVLSSLDWRRLFPLFHAVCRCHWVRCLSLSMLSTEWRVGGVLLAIAWFSLPAFV